MGISERIRSLFTENGLPSVQMAVFLGALAVCGVYLLSMAATADRATLCGTHTRLGEMGRLNSMASEKYIDTGHGPVYPLFLMAVRGISGGENYRLVFLLQQLALMMSAVMAFAAAWRIFGKTPAVIAGIMTVANPGLIVYSMVTLPVAFLVTLVFALVLLLSSGIKARNKSAAAALAAVIGVMLEPSFVFFVPGIALAVKKKRLFLLVFFAGILPWWIRNSIVAGKLIPLYDVKGFGVDTRFLSGIAGNVWKWVGKFYSDLSLLTRRAPEKSYMPVLFGNRQDNGHIVEYYYLAVMLLGFTGLARKLSRKNLYVALPFAAYLLLSLAVVRFGVRHRVPFEPLLILFASAQAAAMAGPLARLLERSSGRLPASP